MQHTTDIHINHAVPFVYLKFFESRERHHPSVIHDYVDSATSFQTELDKRLDILKGCDVQSPVFSSSAIISERFCECLQPPCAPCPENNGRTFSAKHTRCRFPDAAAGAGDENYLVLNV